MTEFWVCLGIVVGLGLTMTAPWMGAEGDGVCAALVLFMAGFMVGRGSRP